MQDYHPTKLPTFLHFPRPVPPHPLPSPSGRGRTEGPRCNKSKRLAFSNALFSTRYFTLRAPGEGTRRSG